MPYTSHGHWVGPGEPSQPGPRLVARCGGPGLCAPCSVEAAAFSPQPDLHRTHAADPDRPCPHENFDAVVAVNRLQAGDGGAVEAFSADIKVNCRDCGEPFRWIGAPAGLLPTQPCVSVDETELRAPLRPASSDPDFGLGIPGFAIRQVR